MDNVVQDLTNLWRETVQYYRPWHERMERESDFALKLRHYRRDFYETEDQRYVQYRGREHFSAVRRKHADVERAPIYIEAIALRPDDPSSQLQAEDAKWALEHDVRDPATGFLSSYSRAILSALSARVGYVSVDFDPSIGPFGRVFFDNPEPAKVMICPPFKDIFDARLPWVCEEMAVDVAAIQKRPPKGWKNVELLTADNPHQAKYPQTISGSDELGRVMRQPMELPGESSRQKGRATLVKFWFRVDPDETKKKRVNPKTARKLPKEEQYFGCTSCGYRTVPGSALDGQGPDEQACPDCAMNGFVEPLVLITSEAIEETQLAYPNGRLVIFAPNSQALLYDGPWPFKARSYPYMKITAYEHPRDAIGISDTTLNWHTQVISNALMRRAYDSVMAAPNVIINHGGALKDAFGQPFQFTDEPWQIAYADPFAGQAVEHFQASPVPPALFQMYGLVQQGFRADIGTAEMTTGGQAEDLKSVAVGTVKEFVESGNIPTDHLIERIRRELSVFFGVVHDIQRDTWSVQKWVRFRGNRGVMDAKLIAAANLPEADFMVTAEPEFHARTQDELNTVQLWAGFGFSEAIAELLGVPPTLANKIRAEQAAKAPQAPPSGAGASGGPNAPPTTPGTMPVSPNGNQPAALGGVQMAGMTG